MTRVFKRVGRSGKVTWQAKVRLSGTDQRSKTFRRKTDAEEWADRTWLSLKDGKLAPERETRQKTLGDAIARYRLSIIPRYSKREQVQREGKLAWWEQRLGDRRLASLKASDISECREQLEREGRREKPCSPATQARYLAALKHVLSVASREWEWIESNAAARVRPPREPRGRVRFLSTEEREALLKACQESEDPRLYPLVVVALGTGARQGELLRLRWPDVNLANGTAILHETKNGERRTLSLAGKPLDVLRERSTLRRIGTDLVFASSRGAASFPQESWHAALEAAKIEDFRFHDLRHAHASYLAMSGASLAELAEALGHKTLAMVKRYAHLSQPHTAAVVARMVEDYLG